MIMVSCSDSSDVAEDTSSPAVECKILFNVEKPAGMRMADAVVQHPNRIKMSPLRAGIYRG